MPLYPARVDLYEEFLGVVDALQTEGIDYAVCGGMAVAIHGYARFTKDIDLLIRREDLDRVRNAIEQREFVLEAGFLPFGVGSPAEREIFRVSKSQGANVLSLDLLLVGPALAAVWDDREVFEWQGRAIPVVSRSGLAIMKRLAGRRQDRLDLEKLGLADEEADS